MSAEKNSAWRARARSLAECLPAPLAAPETPHLKRLRWSFVLLLTLLAALTAGLEAMCPQARRAGGALWLMLAFAALVIGAKWLAAKLAADAAWLAREEAE